MFFGQNIRDTRAMFYSSWSKYLNKQSLSPLEQQLAQVILDHPEYHDVFQAQHSENDKVYFPELSETNPFLHLGLHLAIREQIQTNRPQGISLIFKQLAQKKPKLEAEHMLMECLAEALWLAQKNNCAPDELAYLRACQQCVLDGTR